MSRALVDRESLERLLANDGGDGCYDLGEWIKARNEVRAALAQPAEADRVEDVQVMARVHHNDEHAEPVRAVLNSIGRQMEDDAKLMAVAQHERIVSAVTAERDAERIRADVAVADANDAERERDKLRAAISDPESVFVNMKRGTIAKPSLRSMIDLYREVVNGDEAQLLEIAKLRAEVETLQEQHDKAWRRAEQGAENLSTALSEIEGLRKDKDRLDAIESEFWDVRFSSNQIADTGDYSTGIEIVGHFMAAPCERVLGENYNENLRAALDQAMTAAANPPARPGYDEQLSPGSE